MAEIVGGFLMPHDPLITASPDAPDPEKAKNVLNAFDSIANRLRELNVDTVIIIGDDHYAMFGPHCIPRCLIGIGDVDGPLERIGIEPGPIPNHETLARHILKTGFSDGIDWAFAKSLTVDHSVAVPYHLCVRSNPNIKAIPIYVNAGVMPVIENKRAYQIGQSILNAVETWAGNERVAVFGTGGISHWVGSAEMGRVNVEFDQRVLAMAVSGNVDGLIALTDEEILNQGGNGALEIKNWICAMGAMPGARAELIAYEAVPEWITGLGFAELVKVA